MYSSVAILDAGAQYGKVSIISQYKQQQKTDFISLETNKINKLRSYRHLQ